jgi:hypothetical protein
MIVGCRHGNLILAGPRMITAIRRGVKYYTAECICCPHAKDFLSSLMIRFTERVVNLDR